ncbi:TPA: S-layer homology domain-containing protein [Bacillus cereus]
MSVIVSTIPAPLISSAQQDNVSPVQVSKEEVSDEQALKSIEESFAGVDGRGISEEEVTDKIEPAEEETGTLVVPNGTNMVKDRLSGVVPRVTSTINGVPFTEWIVPKGNSDIRPGYHMTPKYITIHETDNTSVGAGARNHAQYLYNQAVGNTNRAASWHFTVDDKEIYQHLPINENGWHAGDGNGAGNRQSIAIEIAVNRDGNYNKAVENAKKLAAHLMKETGVSLNNVVKHQNWSGKTCPSRMIKGGQWNAFLTGVDKYYKDNPSITNPKDDITGGWYEPYIRELNKRGIMVGEGNGIFAPNRAVTRGEFAQLISNSLKLPSGNATFKDLHDAHPTLREGIKRTASAGIIQGRGNGIFDPNAPITREESAIITDKALQYKGIKGKEVNIPFKDQNQIYDKKSVQRLYGLGIVKGNGNNEFLPKGTTTRGESASFLVNMLQVIEGGKPQQIIGTAQINGIGVNVRSGAGKNYSIIRKASKGEKVSVYEEKNGWLRISTKEWIFYDASYIKYNKK